MKQRLLNGLLGAVLALSTLPGFTHALAPALLEVVEKAATDGTARYALLWRTSVSRAQGAVVEPQLPADCQPIAAPQLSSEENQSLVQRWEVSCAQSLAGRQLRVAGLEHSGINVILRYERQGSVTTRLLDAAEPAFIVPGATVTAPVAPAYFALGVEHLLFGFDHVLLVLGLVLLVRKIKPLVWTITAFTLGHSMTLALATLGIVNINQALTELGIAISILYLAAEILKPAGRSSLLRRRPWLMATAFGLLHGLGFAGALAEVGLPQGEIPLALFAFNAGIEVGQLVLVMGIVALGWSFQQGRIYFQRSENKPAAFLPLLPAYLMGSFAAFWCFERLAVLV